jgi:hypothetical protein
VHSELFRWPGAILERVAPLRASTVKACGGNVHSTTLHTANQSRAQIRASDLGKAYAAMHVYRESRSDASEGLQNSDVLFAPSSWIALGGNL